jgi:hypothetical protein
MLYTVKTVLHTGINYYLQYCEAWKEAISMRGHMVYGANAV